jgi:parallel beta-helix repeat protein
MLRKSVLTMILTLVLIGTLGEASKTQTVKASGTIYIKSDGSIEPSTASIQRIGNTYTFTDNINDSIVIQKDHIVVDGAGYTLQGTENRTGIYLTGRSNVTIKNIEIKAFDYDIELFYSSNNTVSGNNMTNSEYGLRLHYSSNNTVSGNNMTNSEYGLRLHYSSNNTVSGNNIAANYAQGIWLHDSSNNTLSGNHITTNNNYGILFVESSGNTVSGNNIAANHSNGILIIEYSKNNIISGNNITQNESIGIALSMSSNNTVSGNNIANNGNYGVGLYWSSNNNTLYRNNITANEFAGILFFQSSNNTVSGNNIANNGNYGLLLNMSSNNKFYHNHFTDNPNQVYVEMNSTNAWDDGYPSGGNYWSDYAEKYPNAEEMDESGVWSISYIIDQNNQDRYPLISPLGIVTRLFTVYVDEQAYQVKTVSNSSISAFNLSRSQKQISFNVTTSSGTIGFCNITIPSNLLWGEFTVLLDGEPQMFSIRKDNATHISVYFTCSHDTKKIQIIGTDIIAEFISLAILSLFIVATLFAVMVCRRKHLM